MKLNELQRLQQLAGVSKFTDPQGTFNTSTTPSDDQRPNQGFAVRVVGTFVPPRSDFAAQDLWEALERILPNDYPTADYQNQGNQNTPQKRVLATVERQGSAIVKTGIPTKDIAETIASKFESYRGRFDPARRIRAEVMEL